MRRYSDSQLRSIARQFVQRHGQPTRRHRLLMLMRFAELAIDREPDEIERTIARRLIALIDALPKEIAPRRPRLKIIQGGKRQ